MNRRATLRRRDRRSIAARPCRAADRKRVQHAPVPARHRSCCFRIRRWRGRPGYRLEASGGGAAAPRGRQRFPEPAAGAGHGPQRGRRQRLFGDALRPSRRRHSTSRCIFVFESDELTDESRALLPQILEAVKDHPFPDVAVVGHTGHDRDAAGNVELGLRRANAIRRRLLDAGVDASLIEVTSHGESDLLVKTADEVYEPRNRRVEITVR